MKTMKSIAVALAIIGQLFFNTGISQATSFTAQGTLTGVSLFTTRVFNTIDGSDNGAGVLGFNGGAGATYVSSLQAIEVNFNNNAVGNQAIRIYTNNPGVTHPEGMIGVTDSSYNVPMMWIVQKDPIGGGGNQNYVFTGDTTKEGFIVDITNAAIATYANVAFGLDGQNASLANFPNDDGAGAFRAETNGQIWLYFGTNYTGKPAQQYSTSNLNIEVVTLP